MSEVKGAFMLSISNRPSKKWKIVQSGGIGRVIHFGDKNDEDYIFNRSEARKQQYLRCHEGDYEQFRHQAPFWTRWLLWNCYTLEESIKDVERRFNLKVFKV